MLFWFYRKNRLPQEYTLSSSREIRRINLPRQTALNVDRGDDNFECAQEKMMSRAREKDVFFSR